MKSSDQIIIRGLRISCHIGVPDEERAHSQDLLVNVTLFPVESTQPLEDDIQRTVDYYAVALRLEAIAKEKPRKLIETLAEDFVSAVFAEFSVSAVTIEIEKFILPNTQCVGVLITRDRKDYTRSTQSMFGL
jgi:dihydroneopterin aldolase